MVIQLCLSQALSRSNSKIILNICEMYYQIRLDYREYYSIRSYALTTNVFSKDFELEFKQETFPVYHALELVDLTLKQALIRVLAPVRHHLIRCIWPNRENMDNIT